MPSKSNNPPKIAQGKISRTGIALGVATRRYVAVAMKKLLLCRVQLSILRSCSRFSSELELPMHTASENIHRPAIGIVGRIAEELVVESEAGLGRHRIALIGLENPFRAVVGQLPVTDQDTKTTGIEERDVVVADAVDHAGNANDVVRPTP